MNAAGPKILLVDDHNLVRQGVRMLLEHQPGLVVVGEAGDGNSAVQQLKTLSPDIVILDVHLPGENGVQVSRRLLAEAPAVKIIVLSADPNLALVHAALLAGVSGYVTKDQNGEELLRAIRAVCDHQIYLSPVLVSAVVVDYKQVLHERVEADRHLLSNQERQLLKGIAEGKRNKEIAAESGASLKTVEASRSRLMKKLGCRSPAELVRYAIREGIASL